MKRITLLLLFFGLLSTDGAISQNGKPQFLALTNVTLIDPGRDFYQSGVTVLIKGERIAAVFADRERGLPEGAKIHDLEGRYLIPGLIDSHVHLMQSYRESREFMYAELERQLYGGVVAVREMAGDVRVSAKARRNIVTGVKNGPDIYYVAVMAGPHFAAGPMRRASIDMEPGEASWTQAVDSDTDVRLAVARAAGTHASALKLYVEIEPELIREITEEAHRQGLKVWAHPNLHPARPLDVVRAGVDAVSHVCALRWQSSGVDPRRFARRGVDPPPRTDPERTDPESPEMIELYKEIAERGVLLDATYSLFYHHPGPAEHGCPPELATAIAKAAREHGVEFSTGTDYVGPDDDTFPALHLEIEHLVDHGILSPEEALVAATLNGARALGLEDDYGTIEPGKLASLVVLDEDPVQDIRALRSVVSVVKRGEIYLRTDFRLPSDVNTSNE